MQFGVGQVVKRAPLLACPAVLGGRGERIRRFAAIRHGSPPITQPTLLDKPAVAPETRWIT